MNRGRPETDEERARRQRLGYIALFPTSEDLIYTDCFGNTRSLLDAWDLTASLRWGYVFETYLMYEYISSYSFRYRYVGEVLPKECALWQKERYTVPPETEIAVVLLASQGFTDLDAAKVLRRPIGEVGAIMGFHGFSPWSPSCPMSDRLKRIRRAELQAERRGSKG